MDLQRLGILVIIGVVNLGLALLVITRKPRDRTHRAFALTAGLIVLWLTVAYLSDQSAFEAFALHLNRLTLAVALLMGASLFRFVLVFPSSRERLPVVWSAFLGFGVALAPITLYTPLVVSDIEFLQGGTDVIAGPLMWLMVVWLGVGLVLMARVVLIKHREARGRQRAQLRYVLLGFTAFSGVALLNGLIVPIITGSYATTPPQRLRDTHPGGRDSLRHDRPPLHGHPLRRHAQRRLYDPVGAPEPAAGRSLRVGSLECR